MRVLAVDTGSARGSVAVAEAGELLGEVRLRSEAPHSTRLLPAVELLLDGLGWRPERLEGFAVVTGPGSFTGLRVGVSTVQGLALASDRPCLGVSALELLAERIRGSADWLVTWIDAGRDEVYAAAFDAACAPRWPAAVERPARHLERLPERGLALVGDGALRHRELIARVRPHAVLPQRSLFLAGELARLASGRLAQGAGVAPALLRPLYLREADIRAARA